MFACGETGAHQLRNDGDGPARVVFFANRSDPDVRVYPDGGKAVVVAGDLLLAAELP